MSAHRAPQRHELKTWPWYFQHLVDGTKTAEVRLNDRGFREGDLLILREWDPEMKEYTGRVEHRTASSVQALDILGIPSFVLISFRQQAGPQRRTRAMKHGEAFAVLPGHEMFDG